MRKQAAYVTLLFVLFTLSASANHVEEYISNYKDIAQREMDRSNIPASIILAQGIHESSWGRGELAVNSKNHFGIKCKDYWMGPTYYIEDDDYENGKLIKSCFRAYNDVEASYIDHTDFLVTNERYSRLFSFDQSDYINWAKGLKECGYATDPKYAEKLIRIIETDQLQRFDLKNENIMDAPMFFIPPQFLQKEELVDPIVYTYEESADAITHLVYEENQIEEVSNFNYQVPIEELPNEEEEPVQADPIVYTEPEAIRTTPAINYDYDLTEVIPNSSSGDKKIHNLSRKPRMSSTAGPR